jgi:hypothetical protein
MIKMSVNKHYKLDKINSVNPSRTVSKKPESKVHGQNVSDLYTYSKKVQIILYTDVTESDIRYLREY